MRLGIIGCGLIGTKRARAAAPHPVVAVFDPQRDRAEKLAAECPGARVANSMGDLLAAPLDAVVIATTHDQLAPLAIQALQAGKHVLVEKPGARSAPELEAVHAVATRAARVVRVGFNHRFHPALLKAHELVRSGVLGPMMYIRGRYGHGGRIGYDKEWRAVPAISGGGEAIDQGIHLAFDQAPVVVQQLKVAFHQPQQLLARVDLEFGDAHLFRRARSEQHFVKGRAANAGIGKKFAVELGFFRLLHDQGAAASALMDDIAHMLPPTRAVRAEKSCPWSTFIAASRFPVQYARGAPLGG